MGFSQLNRVRSAALTHLLFTATPQGRAVQVNWRPQYLYIFVRFCLMLATEHPANARLVVTPPAFRAARNLRAQLSIQLQSKGVPKQLCLAPGRANKRQQLRS